MSRINIISFLLIWLEITTAYPGTDFISRYEPRGKIPPRSFKFSKIQSFEDVYNVYDPTFLAYVWPKLRNGMHLIVESACWDDMSVYFKHLIEGRAWAHKVADASGRYESGLQEGNSYWLGSKQQCYILDNQAMLYQNNSRHHMSQDDLESLRERYYEGSPESDWYGLAVNSRQTAKFTDEIPPFRLMFHSAKISLNISRISSKNHKITLGVCLPYTCSCDDVETLLGFSIIINDNLRNNKTLPRSAKVTSVRQIQYFYDVQDPTTILLAILTTLLLVVTTAATMSDLGIIKFRAHRKRMSFDITPEKKNDIAPVHRKPDLSTQSLSINLDTLSTSNSENMMNLVTAKKVVKGDTRPPSITLDVVGADDCRSCGKYKNHCIKGKERDRSESPVEHQHLKEDIFKNVFHCFSLRYSFKRICNTNLANRDLSAVHILKILATFWVIYIQVVMIGTHISDNTGDVNKDNVAYNTLIAGTLAFDTLFFVSGVLSGHHFFYLKARYTVEELVSFGGAFGRILQFVCFVTNRAIRLLPSYMFSILIAASFSRVLNDTSPFQLPDEDHDNCEYYWWRNLLYVNTFYRSENRCMQISWFLSLESQLHALATLLLCFGKSKATVAMGAFCVVAAMSADVTTAYNGYNTVLTSVFSSYEWLIYRPWSRVAPYFVGLVTGWLVHKMDGTLNISSLKGVCLWTVSVWAWGSVLLVPWCVPPLTPLADALLASVTHGAWTAAMIWPTVLMATRHAGISRRILDNGAVTALSRLSYGMLLLHGVVTRYVMMSTEQSIYINSATLWSYYCGVLVATILSSVVLSVLVETPCCSVLRRLSDCANAS